MTGMGQATGAHLARVEYQMNRFANQGPQPAFYGPSPQPAFYGPSPQPAFYGPGPQPAFYGPPPFMMPPGGGMGGRMGGGPADPAMQGFVNMLLS
jgi:hypothetical protein